MNAQGLGSLDVETRYLVGLRELLHAGNPALLSPQLDTSMQTIDKQFVIKCFCL